jgi:hypothetical protein
LSRSPGAAARGPESTSSARSDASARCADGADAEGGRRTAPPAQPANAIAMEATTSRETGCGALDLKSLMPPPSQEPNTRTLRPGQASRRSAWSASLEVVTCDPDRFAFYFRHAWTTASLRALGDGDDRVVADVAGSRAQD